MNNYNVHLYKLRTERGLSLKEAAKGAKINRFMLFLYENGYFRPFGKTLRKLHAFYGEQISTLGLDSYPTPIDDVETKTHDKKSQFIKRIIFASLSLVMLASSITGIVLFNKSVNNEESYYGEVYNEVKNAVIEEGNLGHDLITSLDYYKHEYNHSTAIFYKTDNLLYFNQFIYSITYEKYGDFTERTRMHFKVGGSLSDKSSICEFTCALLESGTFYTCQFEYTNEDVTEISNLNVIVQGRREATVEDTLFFINYEFNIVRINFNQILKETTGKEYDFYNDFLPAREKGRIVNSSLQIVSLYLMGIGIIGFFISFGILLRSLVANVKPRLVVTRNSKAKQENKSLPKDINIRIGIPDFFISALGRVLTISAIIFMTISLLAKLGIFALPKLFAANWFTTYMKDALIAGIFLRQFVSLVRLKRPEALLKTIIYDLFLFLFIATLESALIAVTNAWGYDFASLIYTYIPSNIFEIVAIHYIIFLFLFFQPPFLSKTPHYVRYIWHSLSLLPLGFLIFTYIISNSYNLTYGIPENIYVNFWFPNGFMPLSIVCVLFMYTTFGLRLFFERKYGQRNAQLFFYGDRYNLIENLVCCGFLLIVGIVDLFFMKNQVAYYLGLGHNQWIFTLIPFVFFCKYSPNKQETVIIETEIKQLAREDT